MSHPDEDILWSLADAREFSSQDDLYAHLDVSDHLKDAIYTPSELTHRPDQSKTQLQNKQFDRVSFSKTVISGISFRNCTFDHCLFIGSQIRDCEFHQCRFILTNTYKITISRTYLDPSSFSRCLSRTKHQNIGVHLYQVLLSNSRNCEQIEFERDAHFLFLQWRRFQDAYEIAKWWKSRDPTPLSRPFLRHCLKYSLRWIWEKMFGCGLRIRYFSMTVILTILFLATMNYVFRIEFGLMSGTCLISSFWDALYFTTISVTTLGYGDITPTTTVGRIVATLQSVVGFCLFAMFASMLFRKMSP